MKQNTPVDASLRHRRTPVRPSQGHVPDVGVFTLVMWLSCLLIGALGFALPYERPHPPASREEPILVQPLQVELTQHLLPPPDSPPPPTPDPFAPPPPPEVLKPAAAPPLLAVAQPNPAIAFALPIEGPTRIVDARKADYIRPATNSTPALVVASPAPQQLTFGEGEGKQLAPPYPRQAVRQGQEGAVVVRLVVNEQGGVQSAEAVTPSPWPLLNESALRTVRERWRFRQGPLRVYEVSIRFELTQ